jgi:hypothetical protein
MGWSPQGENPLSELIFGASVVFRFQSGTLVLLLLATLTLLLPTRAPAAEITLQLKDCIARALEHAPEPGETPADIELKVKEYYFRVQLARDTKELLSEVRRDLTRARERAKKLLDQNSSNVEETDLFKLDAFNVEVAKSILEAARGEILALTALKTRIGLPPAATLELAGTRRIQGGEPSGDMGRDLVRQYDRLVAHENFVEENIPPQLRKYHDVGVEAVSSMETTRGEYESSQKWAIRAMANFNFGVGPAKEIIDSLQQYARMRCAYFQSVYNYNLALAHLNYAVGEEPL